MQKKQKAEGIPVRREPNINRIFYCHGFASTFVPTKEKVHVLIDLASVEGRTVDDAPLPFFVNGIGMITIDLGDEIIDPRATLRAVKGKLPIVMFEGGSHRFDHMSDLIPKLRETFFAA